MLEVGWCFALWPEGLHTLAPARHTRPPRGHQHKDRREHQARLGELLPSARCCRGPKRQKPDLRQQWRDGNSDKPRCGARARQQTIRTVNAGMAQSVTTLSPLIKHGSWAGVVSQSVMMKNAMRSDTIMAFYDLAIRKMISSRLV